MPSQDITGTVGREDDTFQIAILVVKLRLEKTMLEIYHLAPCKEWLAGQVGTADLHDRLCSQLIKFLYLKQVLGDTSELIMII
jgi:hypothetical protein